MEPTRSNLPPELINCDRWLCWRTAERDGKSTKLPVDPSTGRIASATDPETWTSFERAREGLERFDATGLGFAFHEAGSLVGVDLDDCRDLESGTLSDPAADIVDTLDSYTEVSPSGEGVHVLVAGSLPPGRNRRGEVECYEANRFFTVTGDHLPDTPKTIQERSEELTDVYSSYLASDDDAQTGGFGQTRSTGQENGPQRREDPPAASISDAELLSRARTAANGTKFDRLWRGDTSGYESHSEADMALCALLAFWTGGDEARVDDLFRNSGLFRQKWDDVHFADGRTYGEATVRRAVAGTTEVYEPPNREKTWRETRNESSDGQRADAAHRQSDTSEEEDSLAEVERLRTQVAHLSTEVRKRDDEIAALRESLRERAGTYQRAQSQGDTESAGRISSWVRRISPSTWF